VGSFYYYPTVYAKVFQLHTCALFFKTNNSEVFPDILGTQILQRAQYKPTPKALKTHSNGSKSLLALRTKLKSV